MYHKNLCSSPSANYTKESPLKITKSSSTATFISSSVPFSAQLTKGRTYYYDAECDAYGGNWDAKGGGKRRMRLYIVSQDGKDCSTTGKPSTFVPKQTGVYFFKITVDAGADTRSAWNFQITEFTRKTAYSAPPDAVNPKDGEFKLYAADGSALGIFPLLESAVRKTVLMGTDTITLQWADVCEDDEDVLAIPLGAYVMHGGMKFRCLAPYTPKQTDEVTWSYELELHSPVSALSVKPFFFYMEDLCETEFNINGIFKEFTDALKTAILKSTGETWSVSAPTDLGTRSLSFSQSTIFDAIGDIADEFGCEWVATGNSITFVKDATGKDARRLVVGTDVQTPAVSSGNADYYNRYYAFGSTRNIVRTDYHSLNASVTSLAETRLKLPTKSWVDENGNTMPACAGGYVDYDDGSSTGHLERNACVKIYDDIYPQSDLVVSEVKKTTKKTEDGESYPVYSLALKSKSDNKVFVLNNTVYNKDSNPNGHLISGLKVSINFTTGLLQGKEFEVGADTSNSAKTFFSICPDTSEEIMTPNEIIVPKVNDACILFNIRMPDSYRLQAEHKLYKKLLEDISSAHSKYADVTIASNPCAGLTAPSLGDKISLINGKSTVTTRVVTVETTLDRPTQWTITTGNAVKASKVRTLTESVGNLTGVAANASKSAAYANRAAWKASQELINNVFDPEGSFFTEKIKPLVVETANITVGTKSQQFVIDNLIFGFNNGKSSTTDKTPFFYANAISTSTSPKLHHYAIDPDNVRTWNISNFSLSYGKSATVLGKSFTFTSNTGACYIYARCQKFKAGSPASTALNGTIVLTDQQILAEPTEDAGNYYFLLGMLSSEMDANGSFSRTATLTYGSTTINGRYIKTGRISSNDGRTYFDLDTGTINGKITFTNSAGDAEDLTDALSGIQNTADAAKNAAENIKVGGRNLQTQTELWGCIKFLSTNLTVNGDTAIVSGSSYNNLSGAVVKMGETYTISFDIKGDTACKGGFMLNQFWDAGFNRIYWEGITSKQITSEWQRVSHTFTVPTDKGDIVYCAPSLRWTENAGKVYFRHYKIESGNIATDWTPAPEDVDGAISNADKKAQQGITAAGNAQTSADNAKTAASNAQNTANTANTAAGKAADAAKNAQNTANTANTAAGKAADAAKNAQNTADTAGTLAQLGIDKVNNLKIGGRNYLYGTATAKTATGGGSSASSAMTIYLYKGDTSGEAWAEGTEVTFSCDFDTSAMTGGTCPLLVNKIWHKIIDIKPGMSGHLSATFTLSGAITAKEKVYVQGKWDGKVIFSKAKWEVGNKETSWTEAPEEVDTRVAAAQSSASKAQNTADTAETNAQKGITAAGKAQNTADKAASSATEAKSSADAAQSKAEAAALYAKAALSGNIWQDQYFNLFKYSILYTGTDYTPPVGKALLCAGRDHHLGEFLCVQPGRIYRQRITALRILGSRTLQGGLWYQSDATTKWHNVTFKAIEEVGSKGWQRYECRITIPPAGSETYGTVYAARMMLQINQSATGGDTQWLVSDLIWEDVTAAENNYLTDNFKKNGLTTVEGGVTLGNFIGVRKIGGTFAVAGMSAPKTTEDGETVTDSTAFFAGAPAAGEWKNAAFNVDYDGVVRMSKAEISSASASGGELLLGDGKISVTNGSKVSRFTCDNHGTIASAFPKSVTTNGTFTALDYTKEHITGITALGESEYVIEDTIISATRTITGFPSGALTIPKRDFTVSLAMSASESWVKFAEWECSVTVSYKLTLNGTAIQTTKEVVTTMRGNGSLTPPIVTGSVKHEVPKISKEIGGGTLVETFSVVLSGTVTAQNKVPTKIGAVVSAITISRTAATASVVSSQYFNKYFSNGMLQNAADQRYFAYLCGATDGLDLRQRCGKYGFDVVLNKGMLATRWDDKTSVTRYRMNPIIYSAACTFDSSNTTYTIHPAYNVLNLTFTISKRNGTGDLTIKHNIGNTKYTPLAMGSGTNPRYVTLHTKTSTEIRFLISDDDSTNDGNFFFYIFDYSTF